MPRLYRILSRSYNSDEVAIAHQVEDIRQQLNEQLRCLDQKLDTQTSIVLEMQDFFRKRAEVELEYSRGLDRLTKQFMVRHKADKQKRESWPTFSTFTCWQYLMSITRRESRDHAVLGELYAGTMFQRLGDVVDDLRRTFVRCRDIGFVCHEEMLKVLNELQTAMKQYHVYHSECKQAEAKFKHVEEQKIKVEMQATKGSKKLKVLEKQVEKKQAIYEENKLKALNARNDYLLAIDAANASIQKYFVDDLSLLVDSIDFGYHNSVQRSMLTCLSAVESLRSSYQSAADSINKCVQELDPTKDKHKFIEANSSTFVLPKCFEYQPHKGDEVCQVSAQKQVPDDLIQRFQQLDNRLESLRLENEEMWKSVEEADKNLISMINVRDYDITDCFQSDTAVTRSPPIDAKKKRLETESYYFEKLQGMVLNNNLLARLMARHSTLKKALMDAGCAVSAAGEESPRGGSIGGGTTASGGNRLPLFPRAVKARRVAKTPMIGQPKVFGCNLEEYIEATGEEIPLVIRSCVRAINLYGMHHEGVFRVSGLQVEINEIKAAFEKGEDPLSITDGGSVNSIAGVLKSFFRELKEPLFPIHLFDTLVEASRRDLEEAIMRIREVLHAALPRQRIIVMRYLFAFLNHLSQYSDENLMYPFNLSICFGPTLLPIPAEKDQVAYQTNVNDLIKTIIVHQEKVFPIQDAGPVYEKILIDGGDRDDGDGSEDEQSEEEADVVEAMAAYDFEGRSGRELSFKKGSTLILYKRVSTDWWEGACQGKEGLVADKYVTIKRFDGDSSTGRLMTTSVSSEVDERRTSPETGPLPITPEKRRSVDLSAAARRQQQTIAAAIAAGNAPSGSSDSASRSSLIAFVNLPLAPTQLSANKDPVASPLTSPVITQLPFVGSPSEATVVLLGQEHIAKADQPQPVAVATEETVVAEGERAVVVEQQAEEDIESVLAGVMSDLQSLTTGDRPVATSNPQEPLPSAAAAAGEGGRDRGPAGSVSRRQTPDLVQDLPVGGGSAGSDAEDTPVAVNAKADEAVVSVADAFANAKTNTVLRSKSSSMPRYMVAGFEVRSGVSAAPSSSSSTSFMTDEPGRQLTSFRRTASMNSGTCSGGRQPARTPPPSSNARDTAVSGLEPAVQAELPATLVLSSNTAPKESSAPVVQQSVGAQSDILPSAVDEAGDLEVIEVIPASVSCSLISAELQALPTSSSQLADSAAACAGVQSLAGGKRKVPPPVPAKQNRPPVLPKPAAASGTIKTAAATPGTTADGSGSTCTDL